MNAEQTKDVAVQGATGSITDEERMLTGTGELGREDMQLPRLRLTQRMSKLGCDAGMIHNSITGEAFKEIEVVPLKVGKGRVLWDRGNAGEKDPLCASDNGREPREQYSEANYDDGKGCSQCVQSQWGDDNTPPSCAGSYNYLVLDVASSLPCLITMARTSAKTAKQFNTMFGAFGFGRSILLYASEEITGAKGSWYEWRVKGQEVIEDKTPYLSIARQYAEQTIETDTTNTMDDNAQQQKSSVDVNSIPF